MTEPATNPATETKTTEPVLIEKEEQITIWTDRNEPMETVNGSVTHKEWCESLAKRINRTTGRTLFVKSRNKKKVPDAEVCVFELKRVRKVKEK